MLFNFLLNQRTWLALARSDSTPLIQAIDEAPPLPTQCQWATFLRNHDEVDLGRLTAAERDEVFAAFGPEPNMQLYGRGIRRRLAPMLGGDRRRIELAYSLQLTLPGTPVLRYGEEIGMGDDLSLDQRNAIRTPMQWNADDNAGFSRAPRRALTRPVIRDGDYGYEAVNVAAQERDPASLLSWMERTLRALRECPEFGLGTPRVVDLGVKPVFALAYDGPTGSVLTLHNLGDQDVSVDVGPQPNQDGTPVELYSDASYDQPGPDLARVALNPYGYRWFRLRSSSAR
jgi:maltose alpha-D-glucosyltransferase/alpha-amylase